MNQEYTMHTLSEIVSRLDQAETWLKSKHISLQNTRFSKIKETLTKVSNTIHPTNEECLALIQASTLTTVFQELSKLNGSQLPLKRLKVALGGPFHPRSEGKDGATIQARNALFELELAASLARQGLVPQGFSDIQFQLDGTHFHVECKRPLAEKNVNTNVKKAFSQLVTSMANDTEARGIVAIAIDRLTESSCNFWAVSSRDQLDGLLKRKLMEFIGRNELLWESPPDPRINVLFVCLNYVAAIQDEGRQALVGFTIARLPLRQDAAYQLLTRYFEERATKNNEGI